MGWLIWQSGLSSARTAHLNRYHGGGGSPAWWLASKVPAAIRGGARARASKAHAGEKLAGSPQQVILARWENLPSRNGVPAAPHLAR